MGPTTSVSAWPPSPLWILAGNFSGVIFPVLAQLRGDPQRQGDAALKASNLLSFCVMPLAMLQAAAAAPLVDQPVRR